MYAIFFSGKDSPPHINARVFSCKNAASRALSAQMYILLNCLTYIFFLTFLMYKSCCEYCETVFHFWWYLWNSASTSKLRSKTGFLLHGNNCRIKFVICSVPSIIFTHIADTHKNARTHTQAHAPTHRDRERRGERGDIQTDSKRQTDREQK